MLLLSRIFRDIFELLRFFDASESRRMPLANPTFFSTSIWLRHIYIYLYPSILIQGTLHVIDKTFFLQLIVSASFSETQDDSGYPTACRGRRGLD